MERTERKFVHRHQWLQSLLFCCWSYTLIGVYIVSRVICCWLRSHSEHSPHVMMYYMLNPFDIDGEECWVWLHSHYITTMKCTVLIWKGQLFILISSSLKWCFNVIYISHWLFKLLNVFYYYLMGQNAELNIYIENLISEPFWHVTQFFSCYR